MATEGTAAPTSVRTSGAVRSAHPTIDLRATPTVTAGTFEHVAEETISAWHQHDIHEIEYAVSGVAELRTPSSHFVLPPQHAAWVPAGVPHCPVLRDVHTVAVFLDPDRFDLPSEATIFPVPPVLREMIRYATRWPITRPGFGGPEPAAFFDALAGVVRRQLAHEPPVVVALPNDPIIAAVIAYTADHLGEVTAASVCRAVGISERTLRRRFPAVVGETWRQHLQRVRITHALALLPDDTWSIRDIALRVGFDSPSSFARAFRARTGEPPSAYRQRHRFAAAGPVA